MTTPRSAGVPFFKMHGSGNDFVLIDNRELCLPQSEMSEWASRVCPRGFGVGADGLIFLQDTPERPDVDYVWHFYNADGSRAEMCGNGSRCAASLAHRIGLAGATHVFGTDAGPIHAHVLEGTDLVKVELTPPTGLALGAKLNVAGHETTVHFVNTGVPHAVVVCEDVKAVDIMTVGRAIRMHEHFAPAGTNANFIQVRDDKRLFLRTYERGVEGETFACGTGAAASALIAHTLGLVGPEVELTTSGGEVLQISIENGTVFLQGKALMTYHGEMYPESMGIAPLE
ncbi:diaminopimelate epimerase [Desulfobaculum xiamenense]|uniref:Diaminopimelate epimerase n=1 Tax=Desulfobaculum xiamenense TaxID=995050 RepID=A0A846QEN3_9BACT|nr:diaminopimelate epimerase [Desulfobaculum xiamenense]NJB66731.1 diaminopimelate epimerase [Desulfobaculum xiamenense]